MVQGKNLLLNSVGEGGRKVGKPGAVKKERGKEGERGQRGRGREGERERGMEGLGSQGQ